MFTQELESLQWGSQRLMMWENVGETRLRHPDHRFEWTRQEVREWAEGVGVRHGYSVKLPARDDEHL